MTPRKLAVLGQVLLFGCGGLLVVLWTLNASLQSGERRRAEEQRRASSRNAAMYGTVASGYSGGRTDSSMMVKDIYTATRWPLVALTLAGTILTLRSAAASQRFASSKLLSQPATLICGALLLTGVALLGFAAALHFSNEARIAKARGIDRRDLNARTQTGIPTRGGGTMSVTFGEPSNEARVAETKRDNDLPKVFLLAIFGAGVLVAGIGAAVLQWIRSTRARPVA